MLSFEEDPALLLAKMVKSVKRSYKVPREFLHVKAPVAVDVGANVGAFAVVNHDKFERIICFEPCEYSFKQCLQNTSSYGNVEVYRFAVGGRSDQIVKLKQSRFGRGSGNVSTLDCNYWDDNDFELVTTISYQDLFGWFGLGRIDYLKVDCEGGEYGFLMDQDLSLVDYLAVEIHLQLGDKAKSLEDYFRQYFAEIAVYGDGVRMHKEITYKKK